VGHSRPVTGLLYLYLLNTSLKFAPTIFLDLIIPVISGAEYKQSLMFEILAVCRIIALLPQANNTYKSFLTHILPMRGDNDSTWYMIFALPPIQ
jgi:hypothetical protein